MSVGKIVNRRGNYRAFNLQIFSLTKLSKHGKKISRNCFYRFCNNEILTTESAVAEEIRRLKIN